jgi:two-component system sensor histidine kinase ChiS
MLGTVGGQNRMESTVVSDTVNTAARVEGLTKDWQVGLLLTEPTVERLSSQEGLHLRLLDRVQVKGRSTVITVYEVYNTDPEPLRRAKDEGRADFELGVRAFHEGRVQEAAARFMGCLQRHPGDQQAVRYLSRCSPLHPET